MSDYVYRCFAVLHCLYRSLWFERITFDELDTTIFEANENLTMQYPIRQIHLELDYYTIDGDAEILLAMNFFEDEGPNDVKDFIRQNIGKELENVCDLELLSIDLDFY